MKRAIILLCAVLLSFMAYGQQATDKKLKILSCGIRHESNTFSTIPTRMAEFTLLRDTQALAGNAWAAYLKEQGIEVTPVLHAYSWPGGVIEKSAYKALRDEILAGIKQAGNIDGIFLDMHGALHVEGYADAQVDFINRIRSLVGNRVIISGSFDLHGNLSDEFVAGLNLLTGLRTAPHRDGQETKLRAVQNLVKVLRNGNRPCIVRTTIPILVPGEKSITEVEPLHSIYARLDALEKSSGIMDASIFVGYAWADLPRSAMRVFVVAEEPAFAEKASKEARLLAQSIWDARRQMKLDVEAGDARSMIRRAQQLPQKTVFISDSGDNTTAGAPGDNPQVIKTLLEARATNALFAGLVDEDAYRQCINAGPGKKVKLKLGGKKDKTFGTPLSLDVTVIALAADSILNTPRGVVLVKAQGVNIALLNSRRSFITLKDFATIGLNPLDFKIVVVKLGYLYPELRDIAPAHLMALTSGFCNLEMPQLPFRQVGRPAFPLDPDMEWQADSSPVNMTLTMPSTMQAMSFNIRYDNPSDGNNSWQHRKNHVATLIRYYSPDVLGIQEALNHQLSEIQIQLPEYQSVGVGRVDGKKQGEFNPIFFNKDRYVLLQSGNFGLSEQPDLFGLKGWDSACERIATWVILKEKVNGKKFVVLNTHLDHVGEVSRRESARLIMKRLIGIAENLPIILIGDMNAEPQSEAIHILSSGNLRNAWSQFSPVYGPSGSFHAFGSLAVTERPLIDYIFASSNFEVLKYRIIDDQPENTYMSDHFPVLSTLLLP